MFEKIAQVITQVGQVTTEVVQKDAVPITLGGGMIVFPSLSEVATKAEQIGMILGVVLLLVTISHRIWIWRRDIKESKEE